MFLTCELPIFQKICFYIAKSRLLRAKRYAFEEQKTAFYNPLIIKLL